MSAPGLRVRLIKLSHQTLDAQTKFLENLVRDWKPFYELVLERFQRFLRKRAD